MIEKNGVEIQDNFLPKEQFKILRDTMLGEQFPWFYCSNIVEDVKEEDYTTSPGQLVHMIYDEYEPKSLFYDPLLYPIREQLKADIWIRIKANLHLRLPEHVYSKFHIDMMYFHKDIAANFTTSIFYLNTNNGYTELETGHRIESVANRLVSFPLPTRHRGVTQTDEQTKAVINFGYLRKVKE